VARDALSGGDRLAIKRLRQRWAYSEYRSLAHRSDQKEDKSHAKSLLIQRLAMLEKSDFPT
jgi:hypothetical protein